MAYDYIEQMKKDIMKYYEEHFSELPDDRDEEEEYLNDQLFDDDDITGNASGSYTFCRETAKQYALDNLDIYADAVNEFCISAEEIAKTLREHDWETVDVIIRCYLLPQAITAALGEIECEL